MALMIFANDLAGAPHRLVPPWMRHFGKGDGMTWVDLIFPAFLFIVGLTIPLSLGPRLDRGDSKASVLGHVLGRSFSLIVLGILMVNDSPDSGALGWPSSVWVALLYLSAICAFIEIKAWPLGSRFLRWAGGLSLFVLACLFRGSAGRRIITWTPFSIHHSWYGILGIIGWAYLIASVVFLLFRGQRTALAVSGALLLCLYPANETGFFNHFFLRHYLGIGDILGAHPSIAVAGLLLGTALVAPDLSEPGRRLRFVLLFIAGYACAAMLLRGLYGINKDEATPSWCLWSAAITAGVWLPLWSPTELRPVKWLANPLAAAGRNVLLAYLLSEGLESFLDLLRVGNFYDSLSESSLAGACLRSAGCAVGLLALTAWLNRRGVRLRL